MSRAVRREHQPAVANPTQSTRRWRVAGLVAVLAAGLATTLTTAPAAQAADNSLGRTPIMGFNDWNAFGCDVSAALIEQTADTFVSSGLRDAGYTYLNIDDCWMTGSRNAGGHLVPDPAKFPDGIKAVADYVHSLGLKLGIYESAGLTTCQGYPGSLGHEQTDADDFASWGIDLLKYDNCGTTPETSSTKAEYVKRYATMGRALKNSGRDIVYSICEWGNYEPWTWASKWGNYWRTTGDIRDSYASMLTNVEQNAKLAKYAAPGAFNDPDMLEIGNGGMTDTEYRSEFSLWSIMAAPLIAGTDLRDASAATLKIYTNKDVIAVDQDTLGKQGRLLSSAGGHYVFAKRLADGDVAVALFNSTDTGASMSSTANAVGLHSGTGLFTTKDLWSKHLTETSGGLSAYVPAHATALYRVHAVNDIATAAQILRTVPAHTSLSVSITSPVVTDGAQTEATVSLRNDSAVRLTASALSLTATGGWTVGAGSDGSKAVDAGATSTRTFPLRAPRKDDAVADATVTARASWRDTGDARFRSAGTGVTAYLPVTAPNKVANQTGARAVVAQNASSYVVRAAGAGVTAAVTSPFGNTPAADEYAAVYRRNSVGTSATVTAIVRGQTGATGFGTHGASGIMVRNDLTANTDPAEGVVLYLSSSDNVVLAWAASGGKTVDTSLGGGRGAAVVDTPVRLRLVRTGTAYVGSYSTDGGTTWTTVGTATLPSSASDATQDVGLYHTSGSTSASQATFTGWSIR